MFAVTMYFLMQLIWVQVPVTPTTPTGWDLRAVQVIQQPLTASDCGRILTDMIAAVSSATGGHSTHMYGCEPISVQQ